MKKIILAFIIITNFSITANAQKEIKIDIEKSSVIWKGSMLFSFGGHYGTIQFEEGKFITSNNKITGGTFSINMNSIINTDGDYSEDLIKHLKNEDFFDVKNYPTSKLTITSVEYSKDELRFRAEANLTIKGITKPIKFEAEINKDTTIMTTKFIIDRTDWNIKYGSKGFIKIKDYAISDAMEFDVKLILN